jgi:hypothetical protein
MKRIFICLANSKKYGDRCVAGIELKQNQDGKHTIVRENGRPKWIRPISEKEFGQIDTRLVSYISLTNLAEFEETEACPEGYQSENVKFIIHSIRKVKAIDSTTLSQILPKLADTETSTIFGNKNKLLTVEEVNNLTFSLMLIKVQNPQIYYRNFEEITKPRITFEFQQHEYDFPLTDVDFLEYYKNDNTLLDGISEIYVTVSLSKEFEENVYKLIAGVFIM